MNHDNNKIFMKLKEKASLNQCNALSRTGIKSTKEFFSGFLTSSISQENHASTSLEGWIFITGMNMDNNRV